MHRDLKSGNILVRTAHESGGQLHVKVADFGTAGMAKTLGQAPNGACNNSLDLAMTNVTRGVGTPLWMAPEILAGERYGPLADLYSYGVVLWELAARQQPWASLPSMNFFMDELLTRIRSGERPKIESEWPAGFVSLMTACWSTLPECRPTFAKVMEDLRPLLSQSGSE
eukprot:m.124701 g.124701  ORF g.124701 m.124701 type:complete len:169 (-) comp14654_c0_seq1:218-724(-)